MANELQFYGNPSTQTGITVEAQVYDNSGSQVGSNVSCAEVGVLAIYIGNMPATAAGSYAVRFIDGSAELLGHGVILWDGTAEVDQLVLDTVVDGIKTVTDNLPNSGALTNLDAAISTRLASASYTTPDNASITSILTDTGTTIPGQITALNNISTADVTAAATSSLNTYDAPTKAELDAAQSSIESDIAGLNDFDPASDQVIVSTNNDKVGYSISGTKNTLDDLNDISTAQVTSSVPSTAQIEAALLNEGDGQQLIDAMVQAIGNVNIDQVVLIAAIRADLERNGGALDNLPLLTEIEASSILAKTSDISGLNDFDPSSETVTVGTNNDKSGYSISGTLNTLDQLDTQQDTQHSNTVSAISSLNDFDPTSESVIVGTNNDKSGYSISGTKNTLDELNDVSTSEVQVEATNALNSYDPPTQTELAAAFTEIKGAGWSTETLKDIRDNGGATDVSQIESDLTAVKAKTDQLEFTNNTVDANTFNQVISTDMCQVQLFVFAGDDQPINSEDFLNRIDTVYAEIQGTYYNTTSNKYFSAERTQPSYDKETGQAYWSLPQGASVKFFIKQLSINSTVTIPDSSTATLNDLLSA